MISAATRSTAEWMASEMTATDPMSSPTAILSRMRRLLEQTDRMATPVFRRLVSDLPGDGIAGGGAGLGSAFFSLSMISTISASRHEKAPQDYHVPQSFRICCSVIEARLHRVPDPSGQGRVACSAAV